MPTNPLGKVPAVSAITRDRVVLTMPADGRLARVAGVVVAEAAARAGMSVHEVQEAACAAVEACAADTGGGTVSIEVNVHAGRVAMRAGSFEGTAANIHA
jgi:hypothetical protein